MPLDGSYPDSQAWSCGAALVEGLVALRTGCQLCCALLITELATSTTVLARCQLNGTWPALHSLLNPVFTLTCLIYQNVSTFPQQGNLGASRPLDTSLNCNQLRFCQQTESRERPLEAPKSTQYHMVS